MSKESRMNAKKRKQEYKKKTRKNRIVKISLSIIIPVIIVLIVAWEVYHYKDTHPTADYSAELTDDGLIEDADVSELVELCDYSEIDVNSSAVTESDDDIQSDIDELLEDYAELDSDTTDAVESGDTISVDYTIYLDGEEYNSYSDTEITLGEDSIMDGFDDEVIGTDVGDTIDFEISVSEDYEDDTSLAGQDVTYEVTVNGIYEYPDFDDDFVAENLSDYATTVEEYKEYLSDNYYETNVESALETYITENCSVISYPEDYIDALANNVKSSYYSTYEYISEYTSSYSSMEDYYNMTDSELNEAYIESAEETAAYNMYIQAIYEAEGLSFTDDELTEYIYESGYDEDTYDDAIDAYNGIGYWAQQYIAEITLDYLSDNVVLVDDDDE